MPICQSFLQQGAKSVIDLDGDQQPHTSHYFIEMYYVEKLTYLLNRETNWAQRRLVGGRRSYEPRHVITQEKVACPPVNECLHSILFFNLLNC